MAAKHLRLGILPVAAMVVLSGCATQKPSTASSASATSASSSTAAASGGSASGTAASSGGNDQCDKNGNAQGVTDQSIKLGAFTPLSGGVAPAGLGAIDGQNAYFDKVNAEGGVKGKKIEFVTQDDKYDPAVAQQAARRLETSEKVFAFSGGIGTPNFVGVLPYIKAEKIPSVGPYAPSNQVGVIANPNVYMIWPNFIDEFQVSTKWMLDNEKPKKIAMLQMTGDVGDDALKGVKNALAGSGLEISKIVNVEATTTDYSSAVLALKNTGADWVISINQPTGTGQVIQAAKKIGFTPKWLTQSDMTDESWLQAFGKDAEGLVAATKTAPLTSDDPKVLELQKTFKAKYNKVASLWNAVGYAQAEVTVEALRKAPALTRECFEYSLQHMNGFATGLIPPVSFNAEQRQGTLAVGVAKIVGGKVTQAAPFQDLKR